MASDNNTVGEMLGFTVLNAIVKYGVVIPVDQMVKNKAIVGIEIELENTQPLLLSSWNTTRDGSLRNDGYEYVSAPFVIDSAESVMEELSSNLPRSAVASGRCGLHVHLNCLDLSIAELRELATVLYENERYLYSISGNRHENYHCTPWHGSCNEVALLKFIKGKIDFNKFQQSCHKYSGINFVPLRDKGTIEFRMHKGSRDTKEIINWVNIIANFKNQVVKGVI
jgi:hypothetical protein